MHVIQNEFTNKICTPAVAMCSCVNPLYRFQPQRNVINQKARMY